MEKVFKKIILLYIIHNDSILMRRFSHQDYEVIDVFGFKDSGDADAAIKEKLNSLFGKIFPYRHYGTIESIINKEGVTAHIAVTVYKVMLDHEQKVLDDYTDDVTASGRDTFWLRKDDIKTETRLRDGDRRVLERVFEDRNMDIKMVVDQGDRWIDAKTTVFEDDAK